MVENTPMLEAVQRESRKGPPPVHLWNPPYCGEMDMRIARDGTWFHEGTPIGRAPLVRLFASILKLEEGRFYLVTPVEKLGITVEDAPFIAVDFTASGEGPAQTITFTTNVEDQVALGPDHPLRMQDGAPYLMVRRGLEARVDRKSFYRLMEIGAVETANGEEWFGIQSQGTFFPVIRAAELT
ncbi:DUF1285 domain-containing protein [Gemmobacter serpentinus]|uniref:DUF1285 domain-containing protein n=1 Tax=Gemmobacter serpentinus TaxID=2652247 RepID=UPI00124F41D9|nr:DUF1285 domain-containing protein [Gemmobacter serpentinus]